MDNSERARFIESSWAEQLGAVRQATADPHRLIGILTGSTDRVDAIERLCQAYGVSEGGARAILDNQFSLLIQSRQTGLAQELEGRSPEE